MLSLLAAVQQINGRPSGMAYAVTLFAAGGLGSTIVAVIAARVMPKTDRVSFHKQEARTRPNGRTESKGGDAAKG